jgi:hypothetical protein
MHQVTSVMGVGMECALQTWQCGLLRGRCRRCAVSAADKSSPGQQGCLSNSLISAGTESAVSCSWVFQNHVRPVANAAAVFAVLLRCQGQLVPAFAVHACSLLADELRGIFQVRVAT